MREHGCQIAPSTYYEARQRRASARTLRDQQLVELMRQLREANRFLTRFGARKMWILLRSQGHDVARCTIERLYRAQGWQGATRRRRFKPMPSDGTPRPADLVDRGFWAARPNRLWVADFSYVPTWSGMVYVAFVIDVFSRRIVGWRAATRMTTDLVLDALEQALWSRKQQGITSFAGLVHHTDAGSQYVSFALTQRLVEAGVDPSVGSNHDPYDNALAESTIGLFKAELIRSEGPWRNVEHVELETLRWVDFYNTIRPHEALDDLSPIQAEDLHYHRLKLTA